MQRTKPDLKKSGAQFEQPLAASFWQYPAPNQFAHTKGQEPLKKFPNPSGIPQIEKYNKFIDTIMTASFDGKIKKMIKPLKEAVAIIIGFTDSCYKEEIAKLYFILGQSLRKLKRHDEASHYFSLLQKSAPENILVLNELGLLNEQLGKLGEAEKFYRLAITRVQSERRNYDTPFLNLGLLLVRTSLSSKDTDRVLEAIVLYHTAIQIDDSTALTYANLGAAKTKLGQFHEAQQDISRAIDLENNPRFRYLLGMNYFFMSKFKDKGVLKEAKKIFSDVLGTEGIDNADCYAMLGAIATSLGDYEDAKLQFQHGLCKKPDAISMINNMLSSDLFLGDFRHAIQFIYDILERKNALNFGNTYLSYLCHLLGSLMARSGYYEQALVCYQAEIDCIPPENLEKIAHAWRSYGHVLFDLEQYSAASSIYEKVYRMNFFEESDMLDLIADCTGWADGKLDTYTNSSTQYLDSSLRYDFLDSDSGSFYINSSVSVPLIPITENMTVLPNGKFVLKDLVGSDDKHSKKTYFLEKQGDNWVTKHSRADESYSWKPAKNTVNFIVFPDGKIICSENERIGHYYLAGGDKKGTKPTPVSFAGTITFDPEGKIQSWNNFSGHFQPPHEIVGDIARETSLPLEKFQRAIFHTDDRGRNLSELLKKFEETERMEEPGFAEFLPAPSF